MLKILQHTAIGDALGAGYEYLPQEQVQHFRLDDGYRQHPKHDEISPGMWTDDTMMSVAAARALIIDSMGLTGIHASTLASQMVSLHKQHWTKGYSKGMLAALDSSETGADLRRSFDTHGRTANNGSAMRSACYGVLGHLDQIAEVVRECARLTHQGLGVEGAYAVAAASHYFVNGGTKAGFNDFLAAKVDPIYTTRMHNRVAKQNGPLTFLTVCAAFTAIRDSSTLTQVIERSIRVGGDVDTVAAIAMGVASSCRELEDDIPAWVVDQIRPVAGLEWNDIVLMDRDLTQLHEGVDVG